MPILNGLPTNMKSYVGNSYGNVPVNAEKSALFSLLIVIVRPNVYDFYLNILRSCVRVYTHTAAGSGRAQNLEISWKLW